MVYVGRLQKHVNQKSLTRLCLEASKKFTKISAVKKNCSAGRKVEIADL